MNWIHIKRLFTKRYEDLIISGRICLIMPHNASWLLLLVRIRSNIKIIWFDAEMTKGLRLSESWLGVWLRWEWSSCFSSQGGVTVGGCTGVFWRLSRDTSVLCPPRCLVWLLERGAEAYKLWVCWSSQGGQSRSLLLCVELKLLSSFFRSVERQMYTAQNYTTNWTDGNAAEGLEWQNQYRRI